MGETVKNDDFWTVAEYFDPSPERLNKFYDSFREAWDKAWQLSRADYRAILAIRSRDGVVQRVFMDGKCWE